MSWIVSLEEHGHITESIIHFNEATNALEEGIPNVKVSRLFSDALNKIQTEWSLHQDEQSGVTKAFQTMILMSMEGTAGIELLKSDELRNFVLFDPPIMNHDILEVSFHLDDKNRTFVQREAKVIASNDDSISAAFSRSQMYDKDLGFYLLP